MTLIRHPYPSPDPSPNFDIDHLGSRPIEIKRIHYLSELKYSERKIGVPSPTIEGKFSKDTGVFVTSDQARFDRVTAAFAREHQRTLILARNRKKLALQAWDAGGKPLPYSLPFLSGWDLIGNNPFLVRQGRLYYSGLTEWQQRWSFDIKVASWSSVNLPFTNAKFAFGSSDNFVVIDQNGRQLAIYGGPRHDDFHLPRKEKLPPPTVVSTAKLFSWENARVVCAAAKKEGVVFVITNGAEQRIFDVHLSIDPLKFQPAMRIVGFDPVALKQEITACAYSSSLTDRLDPSLYLAFKGDGIRRYGIGSGFHNADIRSHLGSKERDFYGKSREVLLRNPQHSINVTDLTADVPEEIFGEPGDTTRIIYTQEVVYAVADDQFVYRFLEDGTPDVRIIQ